MHQGSALSPLLFVIVMEALGLPREFSVALPWELLYADDFVVTTETEDDLIKKLNEWKDNMENRDMRVNMNKTKVMISGERLPPTPPLRSPQSSLGARHILGAWLTSTLFINVCISTSSLNMSIRLGPLPQVFSSCFWLITGLYKKSPPRSTFFTTQTYPPDIGPDPTQNITYQSYSDPSQTCLVLSLTIFAPKFGCIIINNANLPHTHTQPFYELAKWLK